MNKIITITLNPAFDIHYYVPQFEIEKENYSSGRTVDAGGKGINISRALSTNGVPNLAFIAMGQNNARDFTSILEQDNIAYVTIPCEGSIRYNVTIHPDRGTETRISQDSFQLTTETLQQVSEKVGELIAPGSVIAFAGRVPKGIPLPVIKQFLRPLKEMGALLVLDSNSFSLEDLVQIRPWLIKPNEREIELLLGKQVVSITEAQQAAMEIQRLGIEHVLVSLGGQGMAYAGNKSSHVVNVPEITPLSTIGAGDSTLAGFISGYAQGMSLPDVLRTAAAFGTAACLTEGTKPPMPDVIADIRTAISVMTEE